MSDFVNIWKNLDWTVPVQIVMNILPSLLCITLHELSHGYVAYRLGDTTAKDAGRLTLNPIKRYYGPAYDGRVSLRLGKAGSGQYVPL